MLLSWYDRHHRELPWRTSPAMAAKGARANPYHVWLSEVMLQQTTVTAVKPYFAKFLARWPDVRDLAAAPSDEVMAAWAGLGYYARARNLKKCAEAVASQHGGIFPDTEAGLKALPGIGDYTSAAVAAIAFNRPAAVMDGNVERVISRLFVIDQPLPGSKPAMKTRVAELTPKNRPGDFAQAMMDLGATICTPKRPACSLCPFNGHCLALAGDDPQRFPVKAAKKAKPVRVGAAFIAVNDHGEILLRRRVESGLLGGMTEVPTTGWTARVDGETGTEHAPFTADWQACGSIIHVFTHFELRLSVYRAEIGKAASAPPGHNNEWWEPVTNLEAQALPTVMKKAIIQAIPLAFQN
jgi:A/G-specific adenine glycosylase